MLNFTIPRDFLYQIDCHEMHIWSNILKLFISLLLLLFVISITLLDEFCCSYLGDRLIVAYVT